MWLQNNVEIKTERLEEYHLYEKLCMYYNRGYAFDWVHDRLYAVKLFRTKLISRSTRSRNPMSFVINPISVSSQLGVHLFSVSLTDVQLDPYEQTLFVLADYRPNIFHAPTSIILTSDLNGNGVRKIISTSFKSDRVIFSVDIANKRLYVNHENNIYIHNYEGTLLGHFRLSYSASHIAVLDDLVFVSSGTEISAYMIAMNQTELRVEHEDTYHLDIPVENFKFKVMDARVQRRKWNGRHICDRTDCQEWCEVRPTGDVCIPKPKPVAKDDGFSNACGQSKLTGLDLQPTMVGSRYANRGDFPWHATLYYTKNREQFCGGTLISPSAVLTAAHCVTSNCAACNPSEMGAEDITVSLGSTNLAWSTEEQSKITRQVKKIYMSDKIAGESLNFPNDIALLLLDSKVPVSNLVMPACLDYNLNQLPPHETLDGYVAGFGFTEEHEITWKMSSKNSESLKYTNVHVESSTNCFENSFKINNDTFPHQTTDRFCIGNGLVTGSPVQREDSGAGITLVYKGLHYLTGVVSVFLENKLEPMHSFGAFTHVSDNMDWLNRTLRVDYEH